MLRSVTSSCIRVTGLHFPFPRGGEKLATLLVDKIREIVNIEDNGVVDVDVAEK